MEFTITKSLLENQLADLQLHRPDTVLIHSSMKSVGPVEGGADTVLDLLMEYFGDEGLLVFPALSYSRVNPDNPVFDVRNTSTSSLGILPELFRRRPGVIRSLHPTHSVAAFGKDAASFTAGHEKAETPCPKGSPWWKLLERRAKIMFIGTGIGCNTFLHGVDEWLDIPGLRKPVPEHLTVVDYDGRKIPVRLYRHCVGRNGFYASLENRFESAGALSRGKFGNAQCLLLDCRKAAAELGVVLP